MISAFGVEHGEFSKAWGPAKTRALINAARGPTERSGDARAQRAYAQAKMGNLRLRRVNSEYREHMAPVKDQNKKIAQAVAGRPRRKGIKLP